MRNSATAKTASAHKLFVHGGFVLLVLLLIAGVIMWFGQSPFRTLEVGDRTYRLATATDDATRGLGLGDRLAMPENRGMVFIYQQSDFHCFWMKNMHFPLDIIWVDEGKRVVHLEENVPPESYPKQFCPDKRALYVVELNAGQAKVAGIKVGDELKF
jgi:uncharacterized membrane protein (UPF0127 family)